MWIIICQNVETKITAITCRFGGVAFYTVISLKVGESASCGGRLQCNTHCISGIASFDILNIKHTIQICIDMQIQKLLLSEELTGVDTGKWDDGVF